MHKTVHVLAGLCLLSVTVAAAPNEMRIADAPASAVLPAQTTVKSPDTPAGRALTGFVESFNAGGKTRESWLETRTTMEEEVRANILKIDAQLLNDLGPLAIVRIVNASQDTLEAIVRHGKSDMHGHLTIAVEAKEPHKVADIQLRAARPEEIKGGA